MSLSTADKEKCRLQLAEAEAKWVGVSRDTHIGRCDITRRFKVGDDRVEIALDYLNSYAFTTGGGEGGLTTLVNPKIGDQSVDGTFWSFKAFDGAASGNPGWVYQSLRLAHDPTTAAALAQLAHLITSEKQIVNPFDFGPGTAWDVAHIFYDLSPLVRTQIEAVAESSLVTSLSGAGWTCVDRKWVQEETGLAQFIVLFKKVAWNAWGAGGDYAADTIDYDNAGTNNERERITKTWYGIDIADCTKAVLACRDGTTVPAPTGYVITNAGARMSGGGSVAIVQTCKKQVLNRDLAEWELLDAHQWQTGQKHTIVTSYEDFFYNVIDLVTAGEAIPLGYTLVNIRNTESEGLRSRFYTYEKVTWAAWGHDAYAESHRVYDNAGTANEKEQITRTWEGIRIADAATAVSDARTGTHIPAPDGYVIISAGLRGGAMGAISVIQTCRKQVENRDLAAQDTLDIHGWRPGVKDVIVTAYEDFVASEMVTVTQSEAAPNGYTLANIKNVENGGLRSRYYVYEKVTWAEWGHDAYACDRTDYDNAGTDNEREQLTRVWEGIRITDAATAVSDARTGTNVEAPEGYVILSASVRYAGEGAVSVVQTCRKQIDNRDLNGQSTLDIHGWRPGLKDTIVTSYEDFIASALVTATSGESAPNGYTLADVKNTENGGLRSRFYVYEKVTWAEWGHDGYACDHTDYDNAGTANEREQLTRVWEGIQIADAAQAVSDARTGTNIAAPEGYVITAAGVRYSGDGAVSVTQTCRKQVSGRDLSEYEALDAHGLAPGVKETIVTSYEDFPASELSSAISGEGAPGGYILVSAKDTERNGLRSRWCGRNPVWIRPHRCRRPQFRQRVSGCDADVSQAGQQSLAGRIRAHQSSRLEPWRQVDHNHFVRGFSGERDQRRCVWSERARRVHACRNPQC